MRIDYSTSAALEDAISKMKERLEFSKRNFLFILQFLERMCMLVPFIVNNP